MKYTKDDLAKMSDFEINTALLDAAKIKWQVSAVDDEAVMINSCSDVFDFNSWNDIMPLAVEHDIIHDYTINKNAKKIFHAYHKRLDISSDWSQSLQRAIACCLILVLQERE